MALARQLGLDGAQVWIGGMSRPRRSPARQPEDYTARTGTPPRRTVSASEGLHFDLRNQVPYSRNPVPSSGRRQHRTWRARSMSESSCSRSSIEVTCGQMRPRGASGGHPPADARGAKSRRAGCSPGHRVVASAAEHLRIIDAVGSPNVQVYYDVANSTQMGYDINAEIRQRGRDRICEFHAKENGVLLGQGKIDFPAVRKAWTTSDTRDGIQIRGRCPEGPADARQLSRECAVSGRGSRSAASRHMSAYRLAAQGRRAAPPPCDADRSPVLRAECATLPQRPRVHRVEAELVEQGRDGRLRTLEVITGNDERAPVLRIGGLAVCW